MASLFCRRQRSINDFFSPSQQKAKRKVVSSRNDSQSSLLAASSESEAQLSLPERDHQGLSMNRCQSSTRTPTHRNGKGKLNEEMAAKPGSNQEPDTFFGKVRRVLNESFENDIDLDPLDKNLRQNPTQLDKRTKTQPTTNKSSHAPFQNKRSEGTKNVTSRQNSTSPQKRKAHDHIQNPAAKKAALEQDKTNSDVDKPSPASNVTDTDDESDDDSFADLREHEESIARTTSAATLRRSSRVTKEVQRFHPDTNLGTSTSGSVFGSVFDRRQTKSAVSALKDLIRERNAREAEEKQNEKLKMEIVNGVEKLAEGEEEIRNLANLEERMENKRLKQFEKYSAPLPLFVNPCKIPKTSKDLLKSKSGKYEPVLDILHLAMRHSGHENSALDLAGKHIPALFHKRHVRQTSRSAMAMFHLVVYDDTPVSPTGVPRDSLLQALCDVSHLIGSKHVQLPTLQNVLELYGASLDHRVGDTEDKEKKSINKKSLESMASRSSEKDCMLVQKARRNLRRLFHFSAERIRSGEKLYRVVSRDLKHVGNQTAVFRSFGICLRVLLGSMGRAIFKEVGDLLCALLDRVSDEHWAKLRLEIAKQVFQHTTRLGLHVDLTTQLLPFTTKRAKYLRHDIAFLSLMQWNEGPGANPQCKPVISFEPSAAGIAAGIEDVSFCMNDVIALLQKIPDFQNTTDDEWACKLSNIIKQAICDEMILNRHRDHEMGVVHMLLKKMRNCSNRMVFGIAVQDMRISLDATISFVVGIFAQSQKVQAEMIPHMKSQLTQTLLANPIA